MEMPVVSCQLPVASCQAPIETGDLKRATTNCDETRRETSEWASHDSASDQHM